MRSTSGGEGEKSGEETASGARRAVLMKKGELVYFVYVYLQRK